MFSTKRFAGLPAALLLIAPVQAQVDCNAGGSIQSELDAGSAFVNFTGTCNEFVIIRNDKTVLQGASGDPTQDVIAGGILALGVQQVSLDSFTTGGSLSIQNGSAATLVRIIATGGASIGGEARAAFFDSTVTGSGSFSIFGNADFFMRDSKIDGLSGGIFVTDGSNAQFRNTNITNTNNGVFAGRNASLRIRNSRLGPALVDDPNLSCNPLCATESASIRLDSVVIDGTNNDPGIGGAVSLSRGVVLTLRGTNVITNNGSQPAVGVFNDSSFRQDQSSGGATQINGDVQVSGMSYADIRAAAITGNVEVDLRSTFRLGSAGFGDDPANTTLTGNSTIGRDSAFVIEDPQVTVNGRITCLDRKSSFSGDFIGAVKFKKCFDFNGRRIRNVATE